MTTGRFPVCSAGIPRYHCPIWLSSSTGWIDRDQALIPEKFHPLVLIRTTECRITIEFHVNKPCIGYSKTVWLSSKWNCKNRMRKSVAESSHTKDNTDSICNFSFTSHTKSARTVKAPSAYKKRIVKTSSRTTCHLWRFFLHSRIISLKQTKCRTKLHRGKTCLGKTTS